MKTQKKSRKNATNSIKCSDLISKKYSTMSEIMKSFKFLKTFFNPIKFIASPSSPQSSTTFPLSKRISMRR